MPTAAISSSDRQRALWLSTIAFTVCFAVWTIFAIIGIQIKRDLGLTDTQFGLLVGTPILTGSLIRLMLGIWSDQYGGRVVYTLTMLSAVRSSRETLAWIFTHSIAPDGRMIRNWFARLRQPPLWGVWMKRRRLESPIYAGSRQDNVRAGQCNRRD